MLTLLRYRGMNLRKIRSVQVEFHAKVLMTMVADLKETTRYFLTRIRPRETGRNLCILRVHHRVNFGMQYSITGINKAQLYWQEYWVL